MVKARKRTTEASKDSDKGKKSYRVLAEGAIIGGKMYDKSDEKGGYGVVKLTDEEADNHKQRGVGLVEVKG